MISLSDGGKLVGLAKETISLSYDGKKPDLSNYSKYSTPQGVFVTLKKNGKLRGCIGFADAFYPLYDAVFKASLAAAFEDTRFEPLQKNELKDIEIEISVLTVPKKIEVKNKEDYLKNIKIGEDGLILRTPFTSGLLLPQVAVEWKFNSLEFLEALCEKAGLSRNAWKEPDTEIYKFSAKIFCEKGGKVVECKEK